MITVEGRLACQKNPERWFSEDSEDKKAAATTCEACPVSRECLAVAVETRQDYGIWGGKTARQRRRDRAARSAA